MTTTCKRNLSDEAKSALLGRTWGSVNPNGVTDCLYYELPQETTGLGAEVLRIKELFFPGKGQNSRIVVVHDDTISRTGVALRIDGQPRLLPSVEVAGRVCSLVQVGLREVRVGYINFGRPDEWQPQQSEQLEHYYEAASAEPVESMQGVEVA